MQGQNPILKKCSGARARVLLLLLASSFLGGCGALLVSNQSNQSDNSSRDSIASKRSSLVARDLVNALVQIETLNPQVTRLQFARPDSNYGKVLAEELQRAGYDLRIGAFTRGQNQLRYSIESVTSEIGAAYEFGITVDSVKLRRQYKLKGDLIKPASSLFVFGASPESIVLDDTLFNGNSKQPEASWAQAGNEANSEADDVQDNESGQQFATVKLMENLFETRRSHYSSVLKDYDDVRKVVLVFGNDSISMGQRNKSITRELVEEFKPGSDVISVIGCSHGKSSAAGQNRSLALGRASRVREELILSGVNPSQVLDEGCWAGVHFDDVMPRRGVVLTLKREKGKN